MLILEGNKSKIKNTHFVRETASLCSLITACSRQACS